MSKPKLIQGRYYSARRIPQDEDDPDDVFLVRLDGKPTDYAPFSSIGTDEGWKIDELEILKEIHVDI